MKKIILLLAFTAVLVSCKSTNSTIPNTVSTPSAGLDNKAEIALKGDWTLTKVSYIGSEYFKATSFQLADSKCFEGSQWHFISNNNKGEMTLNATGCPEFSSPIIWSVSKEKMFSLKIINDLKAKEVKVGYYLLLQNQTEKSFELSDRINVGGKLTEILYHFERN